MNRPPRHVGLIPDGTRRWSHRTGVELAVGYHRAMDKLSESIDALFAAGISVVSVYLLSRRNLQRAASELQAVFEAEIRFCVNLLPSILDNHSAAVHVVGDIEGLPPEFRQALDRMSVFSAESSRKLYLLVGYDAWSELREAMRSTTPMTVPASLAVTEDVDLIIRTGGGMLLSGFLPLQSQYAHLSVTDKLFNELTIADIRSAIAEFSSRDQLYGR